MDMLLLSLLIAVPIFLSLWTRRRLEEVLAPFLCGLMLVLYGLSIFQMLEMARLLLAVTAGVFAAGTVWRMHQEGWKNALRNMASRLLTPGMAVFAAASVFLVWCSRDHVVHSTDDIYYWSIEVHSLFAHHGLVDAVQHLSPRFMTYPPGMQLLQWMGLTILGKWDEPCLYAVLWIFYMAFAVSMMRKMTWKRGGWLLPLWMAAVVCLPTLMNVDAYDMLRVDTALGLCMGYALIQVFRMHQNDKAGTWELVCFGLALCALVLIKQIGIAWAVLAIAFAWLLRKGSAGRLAAACAAPAAVFASWRAVCSALHLSGMHLNSASDRIGQVMNGTWSAPEWLPQLPKTLWNAMVFDLNGGLPFLAWMVLLALLLWVLSRGSGLRRRLMGWMAGALLAFVLGYAVILVFSILSENYDGMNEVGFFSELTQRYGCPLPMGLLMLAITWITEGSFAAEEKKTRRILAAVMTILIVGFARWDSMYVCFHPEAYAQETSQLPYEDELTENFWIDELEGVEDAVVLYVSEHPPYIKERLQYVAAPHKIVIAPAGEMDEESFLKLLETNGITHIVCTDDATSVYQCALELTEDEWLDTWSVYTVYQEEGKAEIAY